MRYTDFDAEPKCSILSTECKDIYIYIYIYIYRERERERERERHQFYIGSSYNSGVV